MSRSASLFLSLVMLAAAIGLYAFLAWQTSEAAGAAATARAESAALSGTTLYQRSASAFLSQTVDGRNALSAFVAKDEDAPLLLSEIESAALREKATASVASVSVVPSKWSYYETLEIKISARGTLAALMAFSTDLESLPQASHLSAATFSASGTNQWVAAFTIDFLKTKAVAPGAATSTPL